MSKIEELFQRARGLQGLDRDAFLNTLPAASRRAIERLLAAKQQTHPHSDPNEQTLATPSEPTANDHDATITVESDPASETLDGAGHASQASQSPPVQSPLTQSDVTSATIAHTIAHTNAHTNADHHADHTNYAGRSSGDDGKPGGALGVFGDYELLEEIARGGMGVVFKARQLRLNRVVALKMILSGNLAGSEEVSRFQIEAEAAAKLDHWGIVPIFEIGEHDGQHYFSMGLVEGDSLADRIQNGPLEPSDAVEMCCKISESIAYAHDHGVIHRDLKPANILIDRQNQPKITDFGLAKQTQDDSNLTRTGAVMGTPGYMPPEQASGDTEGIGPAADIYSIGAILYASLTGHPPFQSANIMDTLRQVMDSEPAPPRQLNPAIDRDLQTICLKCLEKSPSRRYPSAEALAKELQRYQNGEPIQARPIGFVERALRWRRRKPALAALVAIVAMLFLSAPFIAAKQARIALQQRRLKEDAVEARDESNRRRGEAEAARTEAEAARAAVEREQEKTQGLLYSTQISLAHREWLDNNPARTRQLLMSCPPEQRGWEWSYLDGLTRSQEQTISAHSIPAGVEFLPSGEQLLTLGRTDNHLRLWDLNSGLETKTKQIPQLVGGEFPIDDQHVLVTSGDSVVYVDVESGQAEKFGGSGARVTDARMFLDGKRIAVSYSDGAALIFKRPGGKQLFRAPEKMISKNGHEFSPDARLLVGVDQNTIKVWDVRTGDVKFEVLGHLVSVNDIKFSPQGQLLAVADGAGHVSVTQVATGEKLHTIRDHDSGATTVAFSRDGRWLATGSQDHTVRIYDAASGQPSMIVRGHAGWITDIDFHPNGEKLATASGDGSVRIWDIRNRSAQAEHVAQLAPQERSIHSGHEVGLESRIFYGHRGSVYDVSVSPDNKFVATTAMGNLQDHQICVWSKRDASVYARFSVPDGYLHTVDFSADSRFLIVASGGAGDAVRNGSVSIWNLETKEQAKRIDGIASMLVAAALNPENNRLAVTYGNFNFSRLRVYSFPEGEELYEQEVTGERFSSVAFSATGDKLLTSAAPGGTIRVWDTNSGQQESSWKAHGKSVFRIAVSCNDQLATANIDGAIGLWDWRTQTQLAELRGHGNYCVDLDFSPDGTRLVSSSEDDTVKIWNLETQRELLTFSDHRLSAMGADWSDDGRTIASVSRDGSLILRELQRADAAADGEWITLFADDFQRDALGPDWTENDDPTADDASKEAHWRIEAGQLRGTLGTVESNGTTFPAAYLDLQNITLPRRVDVSLDLIVKQPMLAQVIFTNSRTEQAINPFISMTEQPFGFRGSSVLTMRGSSEMKLTGARSAVDLQPGGVHRLRVLRERDSLKLWLDGRLLEHVAIDPFEADVLSLGGSWSAPGDEIGFDNLVVKIPQSALEKLKIRQQIESWLTEMLLPDLVKAELAKHYTEPSQRRFAGSVLASLTSANSGGPDQLIDAFSRTAIRRDATAREYEIAARQSDYYLERVDHQWWIWSKIALTYLRDGRLEDAMERLDLAEEACLEHDGHVLPLVRAARALTLHALGRQAEAEREHRLLEDLCLTRWQSIGLEACRDELNEKVPLEPQPLRTELLQKLTTAERAYWFGRNVKKAYADRADDFTASQGRTAEPDRYDRHFDRDQDMRLTAIFTAFAAPPRIHLIWDDIQFKHQPGSDTAMIQWRSIQKFDDMRFIFGQKFEFQRRDEGWQIVKQRTWHADARINGKWRGYQDGYWQDMDDRIAALPSDAPERPQLLLQAGRFEEAYQAASSRLSQFDAPPAPQQAAVYMLLGEAAINTNRFEEGMEALETARELDPAAQPPWFLTRMERVYTSVQSVVFGLDFDPSSNRMATAHKNKSIAFWDLNSGQLVSQIENAHVADAVDVAFTHDGKRVVSVGWDNAINVHDIESGERVQQFTGHLQRMYRLERHPTRDLMLTTSADNTAKLWDMEAGRELFSLSGHDSAVMGATFRPDVQQIATASADGDIRLWNASTGKETAKFAAHSSGAWRVDYTPDGRYLLSCGHDDVVRMWDVETQRELAQMIGHGNDLEVVRVSPDGKLAASADVRGVIYIWDLERHAPIAVLRGHRNAVFNLKFHQGSLFSVSSDRTIRQWDIDFETSPLQRALDRLEDKK